MWVNRATDNVVLTTSGMEISKYSAACSAGAVFGTLTFLSRAVTGIITYGSSLAGKNSDLFGVYEVTLSDPIPVTEDEIMTIQTSIFRMLKLSMTATMRMHKGASRLSRLGLGGISCCLCCLPCIDKDRRDDWRDRIRDRRESAEDEPSRTMMGMMEGLTDMENGFPEIARAMILGLPQPSTSGSSV